MKRVLLGIAVAATAALGASPASAETGVQMCGFTPPVPCGVCVEENPVSQCVWF